MRAKRRASTRRSFKNPLERKVDSRPARAERGRKGREEDEDEARRGGGEIKRKGKDWSGYENDLRLTGACRSCGEPGKTWWRRGRPREVDGWVLHPLSTGLLGHSYASAVRSPLQMASSLLRNVHFEFPPRPTFQREIYDSPSCFPVRDVASNFSFPLSSFEPFDLKQTCSNSDSLPLI